MRRKGVTIIMCTFNGALRVPKTLEYLAKQVVGQDIHWEIIVVDNASTDNTSIVVAEEWLRYDLKNVSLTILKELRSGKIYALEQAFSLANFEYSIICDDDNWLAPNYLETLFKVLEQNPEVGAVGGQGVAVTDSINLPEWFESYEDGYATGIQAEVSGDVTARGHLWGAGLGTRTALYNEMYNDFPSLLTGRLGKELTAGEDAEYCQRLILAGYKLFYDSKLIFYHYMPASRLTPEYRVRLFDGFKASDEVLSKYYLANSLKKEAKTKSVNFFRLLLISPFRIVFISNKNKRNRAKDVLIFLWPSSIYPNSLMSKIKRFYLRYLVQTS